MSVTVTRELINHNYSVKKILNILKRVGRVEGDSDYEVYLELLKHINSDVRVEAIKNLGKFKNSNIEESLMELFFIEKNSMVKRECVSSIGRQRNPDRIDFFISVLKENDPKIVLQSIRALLVFKKEERVKRELEIVRSHPNEMIQEVLNIELSKPIKRPKEKHSFVNPKLKNVTVNGDVLDVLKLIEDESFHLTFTSPPYYNARDYSFYSSYKEYLVFLRNVFKETHRLTKNGRFLIVNSSPIIVPRVSRKHSSKRYPIPFDIHHFLTEDGWEFIDDIIWKKPEYSVKNRIGGFMQHRKPLGYKPNSITEYLMVYRKKSRDLIDWNIRQYDYNTIEESKIKNEFESTNVWGIDPTFDRTHSAVFPKQLCEKVIRYYSYKNDLVFDPFGGSGTFGQVALECDRHYFLTEIDKVYFERIKEKFAHISGNKIFFNLEEFKTSM